MPLPRGDRLVLPAPAVGGEDDEAGQVFGLAAQAVGDPRAHARPAGDGRPGVHEGVRRVVVDRLGHHGPDDADLVGDAPDVREELADLLARLAELLERVLRREALERLPLELRDRHPRRERAGHRLAVHLGELRLVVERLQVRRPAGHAEEDDPFRLRREVRRVDHPSPVIGLRLAPASKPGPSTTPGPSRPAPGPTGRGTSDVGAGDDRVVGPWRGPRFQSRVIVSWRLSRTRATEVQRGQLGRVDVAGRGNSGRRGSAFSRRRHRGDNGRPVCRAGPSRTASIRVPTAGVKLRARRPRRPGRRAWPLLRARQGPRRPAPPRRRSGHSEGPAPAAGCSTGSARRCIPRGVVASNAWRLGCRNDRCQWV